jgi:hypothetical protein
VASRIRLDFDAPGNPGTMLISRSTSATGTFTPIGPAAGVRSRFYYDNQAAGTTFYYKVTPTYNAVAGQQSVAAVAGYASSGSLGFDCSTCACGCNSAGGACSTTCPSCFVAGTEVSLADGGSRPIERVRIGDLVKAYDERSGRIVVGRVKSVFVHANTPELLSLNGGRIVTTPEHLFFSQGRWIPAGQLRPGDELTTTDKDAALADARDLDETPVTAVTSLPGGVTTYNLEVEGYHTYFVDGVLVHNLKTIP